MTHKRFTIQVNEDNFAEILDKGVAIGQYNACKLLNDLHNENEAFQKADNLTDCETQIMKLKTENKKLKQLLLQFYTEDEIEAELI